MKKILLMFLIAAYASGWFYLSICNDINDQDTHPILCGPDDPIPPPPPTPKQ